MIKPLSKYLLLTWMGLISIQSLAQQDPQYTQYMYNMSVLNPAYATDNPDVINFGALYRAQWVGSEGGPTTGTFFAHSPIAKKVEMGLSIIHDQIGDVVKETNAYFDFAYVLKLNENQKLSFGLKAGATFFSTNFNGFVYSDDLPDPAFANNLSKIFPNIGVGTFYFGENYYLGLSSPNLIKSTHLERQDGIIRNGVEEMHFFFTGGYVFNLNENLKFKPAFMSKAVSGAPMSFDVTGNFLINNVFEIGAGYRWDDSVSGLVNFKVSPSVRIGYAYDYTLSNLGRFNSGSHEIMILFDLNKKGSMNGYDKSPRFF
ncbi:PorP/SprF family type IX secretion system membrane protein [Flavobacterium filum]|uniref:PorP/SprF family type IX secretion system membrane protein n=1 Tax=Flavobacterium filum TaxID=370974 RepID=UPI0004038EF6|nr:type IX secretion system membrane protein PorP/SprF [Flavobacterium filum]